MSWVFRLWYQICAESPGSKPKFFTPVGGSIPPSPHIFLAFLPSPVCNVAAIINRWRPPTCQNTAKFPPKFPPTRPHTRPPWPPTFYRRIVSLKTPHRQAKARQHHPASFHVKHCRSMPPVFTSCILHQQAWIIFFLKKTFHTII